MRAAQGSSALFLLVIPVGFIRASRSIAFAPPSSAAAAVSKNWHMRPQTPASPTAKPINHRIAPPLRAGDGNTGDSGGYDKEELDARVLRSLLEDDPDLLESESARRILARDDARRPEKKEDGGKWTPPTGGWSPPKSPSPPPSASNDDKFVPALALISIAGFLGAYLYETVRLYLAGELYLPGPLGAMLPPPPGM
mmetsp:Transcript_6854/g.14264  ORF Transcript_6854/g.14264 Transcript_6854/m.14264 type:complete len:196 (-) Transcript_6854:130-717(-)|eukprot:CAMPEP_0194323972 /NCGR_PEP_ID=MMETSP0171-20130528/26077_1 /TAXON_ID=218684 /ORGANISM="Corethron pennatum, Strain L29A3" /LENGTH=195 /DNA_ID=CAMNT_0039082737 /DNA_START=102 /DNA_END=689 /DNA_ORIENTATION=+